MRVFLKWLSRGNVSLWKQSSVLLAAVGFGLLSAQATEPLRTEMLVKLPPFVVEQNAGTSWRYCQIPGYEILARCDDTTTERLVLAYYRATQLLGVVLPNRFQIKTDVPRTLILYDQKLWPLANQEALAAMLRSNPHTHPNESDESTGLHLSASERLEGKSGAQLLGLDRVKRPQQSIFFGNMQLTDADSMTTFALVSGAWIDPWETSLTPAYVANLVNARSPSLPRWFRNGFLNVYSRLRFADNALVLRSPAWDKRKYASATPGFNAADGMLPIGNILERTVSDESADETLWLAEAELFVGWGLDPKHPQRVDRFWKFVERTCTEPVSESLFRQSFGMDYAEATKDLTTFGKQARVTRWRLDANIASLPSFPIRDATRGEIARIKGEWERLETRYVKRNLPDLEDAYLKQARRTLLRAFDDGDRDPRLLASLGLLELDSDNKSSARLYLEDAVKQSVIRPRAYFELGQLRYDEQLGRSTRNDGKLNADQANFVLEPLFIACRQSPSLPQIYQLIADVYVNCAAPPDVRALAAIEEGLRLFPEDSELVYRVALLHSNAGTRNQASPLVKLGLKHAASDAAKQRFLDLSRKLLDKQPTP